MAEEPVIRSIREELEELGIKDPQTSGSASMVRSVIREFLLGPLNSETRAQRLTEYKAVEEKYFGKSVRRILDPNQVGIVMHIKPLQEGNFRTPFNNGLLKNHVSMSFEAYVRWNKTKGSYQRLDQIEIISE